MWSLTETKCWSLFQRQQTLMSLRKIHGIIYRNNRDTTPNFAAKYEELYSPPPGSNPRSRHAWKMFDRSLRKPRLRHARQVFDKSPRKNDTFQCNHNIKSYNEKDKFDDALLLFRELMNEAGYIPNNLTFLYLSKSCCDSLYKWEGQQLHSHVIRRGFCSDMFVLTSFVDMYAKMCDMRSARRVFDEMGTRSVVSWTALVRGYGREGDVVTARKYFDEMPDKDVLAYNTMIDAYVKIRDMGSAQGLFEVMTKKSVVTWTTMICGFCDDNNTRSARMVFDGMPVKTIVSWNAMIGGYSQNKQPHEALKLFRELQLNTVTEADEITVISVLPAIADLGALDMGCWVHEYVKRKRLDQRVKVSTSLIDMYAKCGEIAKAVSVFKLATRKATCTWNAIINGLAANGYGKEALDLFDDMINQEYTLNSITMVGVLSACSHCGLVEEGKKWFNEIEKFGLAPRIEYYGCMIDLFGRIGDLDEAEKMINSMPYVANEIIISSFLSACVNHKDLFRAERVLTEAVKMNPLNAANYVLLRNLYSMEDKWEEVKKVNAMMRNSGAKKEAGFSSIETNGLLWDFVSGGLKHPQLDEILSVLGYLGIHMKKIEDECLQLP